MAKVKSKEFYGWAYEWNDGTFAENIFPSKKEGAYYADDYAGYKLVKVKISKYVKKK